MGTGLPTLKFPRAGSRLFIQLSATAAAAAPMKCFQGPQGTRPPACTQDEKPHLVKYQRKDRATFGKIDPDEA